MAHEEPAGALAEREMLLGWLRYQREAVIHKVEGLSEEQARWRPAPTANSLIGLVNHLGYVERWWFQAVFLGERVEIPWTKDDPDAEFRVPDAQTIEQTVAFYRQESARGDEIAAAASLDAMAAHPRRRVSMRWILSHMIEETARHAGHADITRELIDGATGL